jgi:surfactin synthase thioesterase subunit
LPDDVEVRFAQLPGRDLRGGPPLDSIAAMVATLLPAVDEVADLPYAIFGHSMGALIAYELTAAIEGTRPHRPECLFVSARRPPDEGETHPPLAHLDDAEFISEMRDRYNAIPEAVLAEPDLLALLLPLLRADIRAFESYRHTLDTVIDTPLHVFGGRYDARPRPEALAGWQRVARHPITVETFPGGHFFINDLREPLIRTIVARWIGAPG